MVAHDRAHRALWHADRAIDAFVGFDDQEVGAFHEAIHRANRHAVGVLALDTCFSNYIGHVRRFWRARQESNLYQELRRLPFYPLNYGRRVAIVACLRNPALKHQSRYNRVFRCCPTVTRNVARKPCNGRSSIAFRPFCLQTRNTQDSIMNNTEQHVEETIEEHEGLIKTPKQLIVTIILAFLVPVIVIVMLVNLVESTMQAGAGSTAQSEESIASRIKPVAGFKLVDANAPKVFQTGQQVFETTCAACHSTGVAGAPKLGDNATLAPLIASGYDQHVEIAIHGKGAMPPKGGNASLSDFEVERAVVYMANESGASFDEPKEPAADNAAATEQPASAATAAAPAAAPAPQAAAPAAEAPAPAAPEAAAPAPAADTAAANSTGKKVYESRSEERRVGKECRCRRW